KLLRSSSLASGRISMALATHQLAKGVGRSRGTLEQIDDAIERLVVQYDSSWNERLVRQLPAGLHEVKESLFDDVVLLEPVALRKAVELLLGGGRNRGRDLGFVAHLRLRTPGMKNHAKPWKI